MRWAIVLWLLVGSAFASDPAPPEEKIVLPPAIVELTIAPAAPKPPNAPLTLSVDRFRWFALRGYTGPVTWECDNEGVIDYLESEKADTLIGRVEGSKKMERYKIPAGAVVVTATGEKTGSVKLTAYGVVNGKSKRLDTITLLVGPMPPPIPVDPPTPVPPAPTPPIPVPPKPVDPPAPIPLAGLRVLIKVERQPADLLKLTAGQREVIQSTKTDEYLNSVCTTGADGKTKEWRVYDQNQDMTNDAPHWRDAMKRAHASIPWIIISNGKTGFEGPLPPDITVESFKALVNKYNTPAGGSK